MFAGSLSGSCCNYMQNIPEGAATPQGDRPPPGGQNPVLRMDYTEEKNKCDILRLAAQQFEEFQLGTPLFAPIAGGPKNQSSSRW
jgi:hypothetical protein